MSRPKTVSMVRHARSVARTALRAMREDAGLTVREAAQYIGVSPATLSRTEGGRFPDVVNAIRIARFYEVDVETLWGYHANEGNS